MHELISPDSAIDPLVTSQSGVWCKRTDVSHLVVKLHSLYRCRLVRQTPYACSNNNIIIYNICIAPYNTIL